MSNFTAMQAVAIEASLWQDFEVRYRHDKDNIQQRFCPSVMWRGVHDGVEYGGHRVIWAGEVVELVTLELMDEAKLVREGFGKLPHPPTVR